MLHIGSISSLGEEELALTGHTHIQESLLKLPGVNLHRGSGQEYLPAVRSPVLTGAGGCGAFLMAEDNIPLRAAGFCNINELFEAHTENAQRIEVLRGPGTALYGSNAVHGIINVITPNAEDATTSIGLEGGPFDYGRLKFSTGRATEDYGVNVSLSVTHDGGYRDESSVDQQKLSVRHRFQMGEWDIESGITLSNLEQETAGFTTGVDAYKDPQLAKLNPNPEAYRDALSMRGWSRLSLAIDDQRKLVITPYLRYTDMEFLQHFLPGDPLEENGQRGIGLQTAYYLSLSDNLQVITGIDGEFTTGYLKQAQDAPTVGSPFLVATIPAGKHYDYDVDATMVAPYVHLDWNITDRWRLNLGARYEYMDYDYSNNMVSGRTREDGTTCGFGGCRYTRPPSRSDDFDNWSPKFGLSFQINENNVAYLSLARGFRAPQATELYRLQRAQEVADLKSEQIDSLEVGVKGALAKLDYSVAFYTMEKDNVIFRDSSFFNVSDGETSHQGLEVALTYRPTEVWDVSVAANYAEHRYENDRVLSGINIKDNLVDTAPRGFGSARLGWNFLANSRVELEWQHMGSYYLEPENLREYEGHDLLNLRASWSPRPDLRVYARVINVTDVTYAERADFTTFTSERYFPGRPRAFFAGVEWTWN